MKLKKMRIARAKRTLAGRMLCRLLGEETGAVAMEYVVIALLVIAAAVGAAVYFGKTVANRMQDVADITNSDDKIGKAKEIRSRQNDDITQGKQNTQTVSNQVAGANGFNAATAADSTGGTEGGTGEGN